LIVLTVFLFLAPAAYATAIEALIDKCYDESVAPAKALIACSQVIDRGETVEQRSAAFALRAVVYIRTGETQLALDDLNISVQLDRANGIAYALRGAVYAARGRRVEALADLRRAVELKPSRSTYYTRAFVLAHFGEHSLAIINFTRALSYEPRDRDAMMARALLYEQTGDATKAIADYTQMLELDPEDVAALEERAYLYMLSGNVEAARADVDAVTRLTRPPAPAPTDPKLYERPPCDSPYSMISPCYAPPGYRPPPPATSSAPPASSSSSDTNDWRSHEFEPFHPPELSTLPAPNVKPMKVEPYKLPPTSNPPPRPPARQDYLYYPYDTRNLDPRTRDPRYDPNRDPYRYDTNPEFSSSNPYAKHPRYRGIYSPFLGGESYYTAPQTLGPPMQPLGGWPARPQERQRYNPFAPPLSGGAQQRPLSTPLGQPTPPCKRPRNPYAPHAC
jgi:Flp pilus assembly protein TadD